MKRITFFVLSLLVAASSPCFALDYTISFTGSGASTTVDNVIVQNLTQGTTVNVPAGNVLNLTGTTAIEQVNATDEFIRIYPNATEGKSTLSFFSKQAGSTQINVFSIDGRKIAGITENVQSGVNSFQLSLPNGSFVIQVIGNEYAYTTKTISNGATLIKPELAYMGADKPTSSHPQKTKSSSLGVITMAYATGDQLLYKAVSGNYSTIVTDKPIGSKTTNFGFVDCTDADGNHYTVVTIGTQTWMAENLKTAKYKDGSLITNVSDSIAWMDLNWTKSTIGIWCNYKNDAANDTKYGKLYNWYAATDTRTIAPTGWHVPTDAEWSSLTDYVTANLGTSLNAAKALAVNTDWATYSTTGTIGCNLTLNNSTGFSALPHGGRNVVGAFVNFGSNGYLWSVTEGSTGNAWYRGLSYNDSGAGRYSIYKQVAFSIRCVRDN